VVVELGLVEQRYAAALEVINDAAPVTEVAVRFGVTRQTVRRWLRRYAAEALAGFVDQPPVAGSCRCRAGRRSGAVERELAEVAYARAKELVDIREALLTIPSLARFVPRSCEFGRQAEGGPARLGSTSKGVGDGVK
jgi:transposase-like protein